MTTLFSDGQAGSTMETAGDLSAWGWTEGSSITVSTTQKHHGVNSAKGIGDGRVAKGLASAYSNLYFRQYVYFDSVTANKNVGLQYIYSSDWSANIEAAYSGYTNKWQLVSGSGWHEGLTGVTAGVWYSVLIRRLVGDATHGKVQMWVNGSLEVDITEAVVGNSQYLKGGLGWSDTGTQVLYADCFVVADVDITDESTGIQKFCLIEMTGY
jgi:hypothetical protein